jgi:hypothetical protein
MVSRHIYIVFQNLSMCHTYIYSIGPMPKFVEYQFFEQFSELPSQFSLDMSSLWPGHIRLARDVCLRVRTCPNLRFSAYIRGLCAPIRTLDIFSLTPSLAAVKGSLSDFKSSSPNPFDFLEILLSFSSGSLNPKWFSLSL